MDGRILQYRMTTQYHSYCKKSLRGYQNRSKYSVFCKLFRNSSSLSELRNNLHKTAHFCYDYQGRRDWVRAQVEKYFSAPPQAGGGMAGEIKHRASYARWPLATSAVNATNHCLITSDTIEKTKTDAIYSGHGPASGAPGPR